MLCNSNNNWSTQGKREDALQLQQQLVKGEERFFQFSLYVTIFAGDEVELEQITKQVSSTLGSLLITTFSALLQQADGFKATLPSGQDHLLISRNMDTTSLATTFPFTSSELTSNEGILYGINEHNGSLVIFDRFTLENANTVVFAKAGAGKSGAGWEKTLIMDPNGDTKMVEIGKLVDNLINVYGKTQIDHEMEGVILPNYKTLTFDENLVTRWAPITIAARKNFSPRNRLYTITTKSGRQITVTADHNLVIMRNGKIRALRSEVVKTGEAIPLPRQIPNISNKSLSGEWLTLLGLITSKGLIYPNIVCVYNTDPEVLQVIDMSFGKLGIPHRLLRKPQGTVGFASGKKFAGEVIALGAGGRSGEKRVPGVMFSLSNSEVAQYLRAYYEGDGGTEEHEVTATTKSKNLASDLLYLLLRFGIIARIHPKQKRATNTNQQKETYYQITVSGQDHLSKFAKHIGFLTDHKNARLRLLLKNPALANTDIDTIPTLAPVFKKLNNWLYPSSEIKTPQIIIDLKKGEYNPSRDQLLQAIYLCKERITKLKSLRENILLLRTLPSLAWLIRIGSKSRFLNKLLWQNLGHSWQTMKSLAHQPLAKNALLAYQTISGQQYRSEQIGVVLYESFKEQGVSLQEYDKSLWSSLVTRKTSNSRYNTIFKAARFITKKYRSTQLKVRHAQTVLDELKRIANSDLFWDPITKIERIKHKEKYVYDLQVDNGVFLAGEGGMFVHNSYMVKLEILRSLMFGTEIIIIDPENEYKTLSDAVGGEYINFSFNSTCRINPFDLSSLTQDSDENELNMKILSLHSLFKVIMGQMSPSEEAILDRALVLTYKMKGITTDPETQKKDPPLMEDLYKALVGMEDAMSQSLADRIEKFVKGSFAGIIDQPSNVELNNPFTVFSVRDLEDAMKPIAIFIILDYIWTKMRRVVKKRLLIVDEAWYLMRSPDSASFLYGIAKRARKYFLGLTTITQDVEDFLSTDFGKAIVTNSSIQFLMKQSPAAIDKVATVFYLSEGEKHLLLSAEVGEGLFFAGNNHVAIKVVASPDEHKLVTTKPQEIYDRVQKEEKSAQELRLVSETE
ncbi:ATP-binding protein [Candidatus Amesbacteria bacterium]|nr:ATP-binding protein [Candidatus Amesbacteria bacterium]